MWLWRPEAVKKMWLFSWFCWSRVEAVFDVEAGMDVYGKTPGVEGVRWTWVAVAIVLDWTEKKVDLTWCDRVWLLAYGCFVPNSNWGSPRVLGISGLMLGGFIQNKSDSTMSHRGRMDGVIDKISESENDVRLSSLIPYNQ